MGKFQVNIGLADVDVNPLSMETSFTSVPFEFSATTSTTIWESIDFAGAYGTVIIVGSLIAGTTRIAINGLNTTRIIDNSTFARTSNPLNSVAITYTTAGSLTTSFSASITANKFSY